MADYTFCDYLALPVNLPKTRSTVIFSGRMFPDNPEFYDFSSDLYGPGNVYCWVFVVISMLTNWIFRHKYRIRNGGNSTHSEFGLSAEVCAVVLYPIFAATDLLVKAIRLTGTERRAESIFCLSMGPMWNTTMEVWSKMQLDPELSNGILAPGDDVLDLGRKAISISGPLTVCYAFAHLCLSLEIRDIYDDNQVRRNIWTRNFFYVGWGYVVIMLVIFHISMAVDHLGSSLEIYFMGQSMGFLVSNYMTRPWLLVFIFDRCYTEHDDTSLRQNEAYAEKPLRHLFLSIVTAAASVGFFLLIELLSAYKINPDVGMSLSETGQLAAFLGGALTLWYAIYSLSQPDHQESALPQAAQPLQGAEDDQGTLAALSPDSTTEPPSSMPTSGRPRASSSPPSYAVACQA
ncbi:hypothetical protein QBC43DRAFT_319136 [Cladorrhinum sp. PSN259]|nr:hypothetical protein QBC43DRAFT_319136 [Cladorrhinum sp. PSN259]